MIDLERNKRYLKEEIEKHIANGDFEDVKKNFEALLAEKEDDPDFKDLVKQFRIADGNINQAIMRRENRKPRENETFEDPEFQKFSKELMRLTDVAFEIRNEILTLHFQNILKEEI